MAAEEKHDVQDIVEDKSVVGTPRHIPAKIKARREEEKLGKVLFENYTKTGSFYEE